jgi:hypothetical protein
MLFGEQGHDMFRGALLLMALLFNSSTPNPRRINSWHTDLTVAPDGQLTVTEEISIHAEGVAFKRGIVRKLPLRFTDHTGREHRVQYDLTAVEIFGAPSPHHTATEGDDLVLYVGSEGNFLEPATIRTASPTPPRARWASSRTMTRSTGTSTATDGPSPSTASRR